MKALFKTIIVGTVLYMDMVALIYLIDWAAGK